MKKRTIVTFATLLTAGMAQASVITTHQDARVVETNPNGNYGTAAQLRVLPSPGGTGRKSYMKFNLGAAPAPVSSGDVTLSFMLDTDNVTGGTPTTTARIGVYGIIQSATSDTWAETGINWGNAPANTDPEDNGFTADAVWLGDVDVDNTMVTGTSGAGYELSLSNQALVDFVNADTDGQVSIALNITVDTGVGGFGPTIAAREHATLDAATLEVIPEPATMALFGLAAAVALFARRLVL